MSGRVYEKACCPICGWSSRTFNLPAHYITKHPTNIIIGKSTGEHCMYASVNDNGEEKPFCVCLTCKKGVYSGPLDRQGSRWVAIHAKEEACKLAHRDALQAFKQQVYAPDAPIGDNVNVLWEECRSDKRMRPMVDEIQRCCVEMDGEFQPTEGFKQVIRAAIGFKKEVTRTQAQINQMVADHEQELINMRIALSQNKKDNEGLRYTLSCKGEEIDALCLRLAAVEKELADMKGRQD